ncbi:4-coumarate--CoA ligase protein [Dioscorea alata]|uniref:4-coumarate--CoA ligase protein n=1 Tax=Dioscorea alata TaxID=55571 RepID=A0ACB7WAX3_DIOAL|nr:4-coumarate--CoA ligase protein [Dioscorea alata]
MFQIYCRYPFGKTEEIPMAFVVKKSKSILTKEEIMDFVAKQVDPHKKIKGVVFIDAIPKSQGGKILKKELRNLALKSF